jgi:Uma2 family endonuclease
MSTAPFSSLPQGDYAWELATLFPEQGGWSEYDYLQLTDDTNGRVELTDGRLEFLPMPTTIHESLIRFLFLALHNFVGQRNLGDVYFNGIRLRVRPDKIRLPDVIFLHRDHFHARHNSAWDGADLVMEVVSSGAKDRDRDYRQKLVDYAEGNVGEYWIVDPQRQVVQVHRLQDGAYALHGEFTAGQAATSALLEGFAVDVAALFAVMKEIPE